MGSFHCNAHANNVVIPAPGSLKPGEPGAQRLLAGLDLDMAFDAHNFVKGWPVDSASDKPGMEAAKFANLQQFEYVNLLDAISGGDASNGVPMGAFCSLHRSPLPVR